MALGDWQQQSIYLAICAGDLDKGSVLERRPISLLSGPPPVVYFLLELKKKSHIPTTRMSLCPPRIAPFASAESRHCALGPCQAHLPFRKPSQGTMRTWRTGGLVFRWREGKEHGEGWGQRAPSDAAVPTHPPRRAGLESATHVCSTNINK